MSTSYKPEYAKTLINLKNTIGYQENSIVSKVFITKEQTSLTLFAFDEGQAIDTHSAPVDAIVQVIEGEVEIEISGQKYDLKEGEMILMPKGEPHALKAKTDFKMLLFKV
ncbi:MAG: cupin [Candidatus Melainabacteria bacterium GWA2_34_9]|nr:MAG: cupin [Candidatus Melainabacteria bacterium GWA2_34_9]